MVIVNNKITIVIVCYNSIASIEATLENIADKLNSNVHCIVIDGGSKDGTVEIIKKYQDIISYWSSEPDAGIYDAMNKGWEKADNESYILFLGAGDLIINLPNNDSFKKTDIIAGYVRIGDRFLYKPTLGIRLKLGNTLHHQALLIKKSLHIDPPFNLLYKTYADFDFNQRLYRAGNKIYIDPKFVGYALEGGLSSRFDRKQSLEVVRKNFGWFYMILASIYYYLRYEV